MRSGTEAQRNVYVAPITVLALVAFLLIDTVGSFEAQINSGRPRDLINQEPCWTPEKPDDISGCELDD